MLNKSKSMLYKKSNIIVESRTTIMHFKKIKNKIKQHNNYDLTKTNKYLPCIF